MLRSLVCTIFGWNTQNAKERNDVIMDELLGELQVQIVGHQSVLFSQPGTLA